MPSILALLIVFVVTAINAHASTKPHFPISGPSFCDVDAQRKLSGDPYYQAVRFEEGPFAGHCGGLFPVVRAPRLLFPQEAPVDLVYRNDRDLVITNVVDSRGQLNIARIQLSAIKKVWMVKDYFRYPASHAAFLFELESAQPVHLLPQAYGHGQKVKAAKYLLYSLTGVQPEGDSMSLRTAFTIGHKRVLISRTIRAFETLEEFSRSNSEYRRLELFSLELSAEKSATVFTEGLQLTIRRGYKDFFSGLNHNCIHDIFRVLDSAIGWQAPTWFQDPVGLEPVYRRLPFTIEALLIERKLWKEGAKPLVLRPGQSRLQKIMTLPL